MDNRRGEWWLLAQLLLITAHLLPVLKDQPVLTAELGRKARLRALERYTISSNIDALEQLYADLMLTSTVAA